MPAGLPLNETGTTVLDGAGAGTARAGPTAHGETWHPAVAAVHASGAAADAQCFIYAGSRPGPESFRDATSSGSSGDASSRIAGDVLTLGAYIWAVWAGGDPGATATLTVTGTRDIPP